MPLMSKAFRSHYFGYLNLVFVSSDDKNQEVARAHRVIIIIYFVRLNLKTEFTYILLNEDYNIGVVYLTL